MSDAPLGSFEEQVMVAVLRTDPAAYGMAVRRAIEAVTGRDVTIGSVYATLDRLEAKGLVQSMRGEVEGAPLARRLFGVTRAGALALAETRTMRRRLWEGVTLDGLLGPEGAP